MNLRLTIFAFTFDLRPFVQMGGFLKLTGADDVVWANPFGLAPSMGLLFPYGINFLEKISACITEVGAASLEIAATSGVALIWRVFTVAYHCLPAEPEFEAGLMLCSSALYVDGKLPVDLGRAVQVDGFKTHVESAHGFSA